MKQLLVFFTISLYLLSCSAPDQPEHPETISPSANAQWLNPFLYNDDFDRIVSFPIWFNDSLIQSHRIRKITKRIYPRIITDTSHLDNYKNTIPREKREYYFSEAGNVERLVIYVYYDDREIARASFNYESKTDKNGFAKCHQGIFEYLSDTDKANDFRTDFQSERKYNFVLFQFLKEKKKYLSYQDTETGEKLLVVKQPKYWGPLSVDTILKPAKEDWIVWGSLRQPHKIYKVETKVKESDVHIYNYHPSGALKNRIIKDYPLENRRAYQYDHENKWTGYIDSVFSENTYISRTINTFVFDEYARPVRMQHQVDSRTENPFGYLETFSYSTR